MTVRDSHDKIHKKDISDKILSRLDLMVLYV